MTGGGGGGGEFEHSFISQKKKMTHSDTYMCCTQIESVENIDTMNYLYEFVSLGGVGGEGVERNDYKNIYEFSLEKPEKNTKLL